MDAVGVVLVDGADGGSGGLGGGSAFGGGRSLLGGSGGVALNFINQAINFIYDVVDRLREGVSIFNFFNFPPEEVHSLEQHIEQFRLCLLRNHIHPLFADDEEHVLDPVSHRHQGAELHHGGRTLDSVHDTENLIDTVLGKCIRLFRSQQDPVQLLQQGVGLIQIHIQNAVAHKNATFS